MLLERLRLIGIIPTIGAVGAERAKLLADALCGGGLTCAEISFAANDAEETIRRITDARPEMLIGAGAVSSCEQADKAVGAGAKFITGLGFNPEVIRHCLQKGVTVIPGCGCPSDIERAAALKLNTVKLFLGGDSDGVKTMRAYAAAYEDMRFIPVGGINKDNMNDYLSIPQVLACAGSWMILPEKAEAGGLNLQRSAAREALHCALGFELAHVGVNTGGPEDSKALATLICDLFGFTYTAGARSNFAGTAIEVVNNSSLGKNGHLAIGTNNVDRAVCHLKACGVGMREDMVERGPRGEIIKICLEPEFGGFAIHLLQKDAAC